MVTVNPGAGLRDWLNARDVRRWERADCWPLSLERTYWTAYEYQRDLERLRQRRYRLIVERATLPYEDTTPNVTLIGPRQVRARPGRQAVLYRVSYERSPGSAPAGRATPLPPGPQSAGQGGERHEGTRDHDACDAGVTGDD